jgi:hypothetical protein
MMNTNVSETGVVAAMFENRAAADTAREALVAAGVERGTIDVVDQNVGGHADEHARSHGIWERIRNTLVPHQHAHGYAEGVERGHATLFVRAPAERQAEVMALLEQQHPIDVMNRVQEWTAGGWSGVHRSQAAAAQTRAAQAADSGAEAARAPMLFEDRTFPDHVRTTGLLNEDGAGTGVGAPLVNPMGIAVPGIRVSGTDRVRRYEPAPDEI